MSTATQDMVTHANVQLESLQGRLDELASLMPDVQAELATIHQALRNVTRR